MFEHFTQASCGPCAAQNPAFHSLMNAGTNPTNATSIKYHTSWPGVDPMNAYNATDVATRVTYYGVSGVPNVRLGSMAIGSPVNVTQAIIDNEAKVKGVFDLNLTAVMNAGRGLTISGSLSPKVALPNSNYRLQVYLLEDPINYASAPGTNGETSFPSVFRKAFPSSAGTAITNIATGTTTPFNFTGFTIPTTFQAQNLEAIAFIQNHTTKEILMVKKVQLTFPTSVFDADDMVNGLYPNPAQNEFNLSLNLKNSGKVQVHIVNALGQSVLEEVSENLAAGKQSFRVSTEGLSDGIYWVVIRQGEIQQSTKLMVRH